jgi:hypothetical protein
VALAIVVPIQLRVDVSEGEDGRFVDFLQSAPIRCFDMPRVGKLVIVVYSLTMII